MAVEIVRADLSDAAHQRDVVALIDAYAADPMGAGAPLPDEVRARLIDGLRGLPTTVILLAYVDGQAAGIATCFLGFSTFAARRLLNIHDLAVRPEFRGQGLSRALLAAAEEQARALGCCKVTLEVLDTNQRALRIYLAAGYAAYGGGARFYAKPLS